MRAAGRVAMSLVMFGAFACSLLEGSSDVDEDGDDDDTTCSDGELRECTGNLGCSGFSVCQNGRTGECICSSSGTGGAGGTGGPTSGAGGTGSDGTACRALLDCCGSPAFPESARSGCLDIVNTNDANACSTVVTVYASSGFCGGGGTGGSPAGGTGGATTGGTGGATTGGATTGGATTGGVAGQGGAISTGGTGGGQPTCGSSFQVLSGGYVTSPSPYVAGVCWTGYAYTSTSATATISPADFSTCVGPCSLCVSGNVPPTADYSGFALLGFNVAQAVDSSQPATATLRGDALELTYLNNTAAALRVQIVGLNGETSADERWCAPLPNNQNAIIPLSTFNTQCWEGGMGVAYAGQPILGIQIIVPGGNTTDTPFDFCLASVVDAIRVQ